MNSERGKSTLFNLILVLLVIYGAFALVKHLGANFQQRSIAAQVKDRLSIERGPDFTAEKGARAIREILEKEGVILDETQDGEGLVDVQIDQERQMIEYLIRYELEVNFFFFTQRRVFEIEDEIQSYS